MSTDDLAVHIKYKGVEQTFSGKPEDVWLGIDRFFSQLLPTFEIARKLALHIDIQTLVNHCEGIIAFSHEGPNLLITRDKLTDNEMLGLLLLAAHIGSRLGKNVKETVSKSTLQTKLGKGMKITSTRLGEMSKAEIVTKMGDDEYKITTFGLLQMQQDILPRIKARAIA